MMFNMESQNAAPSLPTPVCNFLTENNLAWDMATKDLWKVLNRNILKCKKCEDFLKS